MIALPPFEEGAANVMVTWPLPGAALRLVGGFGTVAGTTLFEGADGRLVPITLVAVTVKVYVVPLFSPVTVIGDEAPVAVTLSGLDVTV